MIRFIILKTTKSGKVCASCFFPSRLLMQIGPFGRMDKMVNMFLCKKCCKELRAALDAEPMTAEQAAKLLQEQSDANVSAETSS